MTISACASKSELDAASFGLLELATLPWWENPDLTTRSGAAGHIATIGVDGPQEHFYRDATRMTFVRQFVPLGERRVAWQIGMYAGRPPIQAPESVQRFPVCGALSLRVRGPRDPKLVSALEVRILYVTEGALEVFPTSTGFDAQGRFWSHGGLLPREYTLRISGRLDQPFVIAEGELLELEIHLGADGNDAK